MEDFKKFSLLKDVQTITSDGTQRALTVKSLPIGDKEGKKAFLVMLNTKDSIAVHGAFFDEDRAYKYLGEANGFILPIEIL